MKRAWDEIGILKGERCARRVIANRNVNMSGSGEDVTMRETIESRDMVNL